MKVQVDLVTLSDRVTKLESQNRLLRRVLAALLALMAMGILASQEEFRHAYQRLGRSLENLRTQVPAAIDPSGESAPPGH